MFRRTYTEPENELFNVVETFSSLETMRTCNLKSFENIKSIIVSEYDDNKLLRVYKYDDPYSRPVDWYDKTRSSEGKLSGEYLSAQVPSRLQTLVSNSLIKDIKWESEIELTKDISKVNMIGFSKTFINSFSNIFIGFGFIKTFPRNNKDFFWKFVAVHMSYPGSGPISMNFGNYNFSDNIYTENESYSQMITEIGLVMDGMIEKACKANKISDDTIRKIASHLRLTSTKDRHVFGLCRTRKDYEERMKKDVRNYD